MPSLLDDLLAEDTSRVYHATWKIVRTCDAAVLDPLMAALPQIRRSTDKLELGGALHPNRASFEHALATIEKCRDNDCWCGVERRTRR